MQPLENGEIIRPLGAQLVFEFLVGKDTFFYQELYGSIGHCQCADREFLQCNGVFFDSSAIGSPEVLVSSKGSTLAAAIPDR